MKKISEMTNEEVQEEIKRLKREIAGMVGCCAGLIVTYTVWAWWIIHYEPSHWLTTPYGLYLGMTTGMFFVECLQPVAEETVRE